MVKFNNIKKKIIKKYTFFDKKSYHWNKAKCYNPLRFLEYNYYILDTFDNFKTFISENPKKPGKEDNERKEEILKFLKPYNDDKEINPNDENTLKKVYEGIKKFYKQSIWFF